MMTMMTVTSFVTVPSPSLSMDLKSFSRAVSSPMNSWISQSWSWALSLWSKACVHWNINVCNLKGEASIEISIHFMEELFYLFPGMLLLIVEKKENILFQRRCSLTLKFYTRKNWAHGATPPWSESRFRLCPLAWTFVAPVDDEMIMVVIMTLVRVLKLKSNQD